MGVFGSGLYSGDFALDLRSAIRAVSRLPFHPDKLVAILTQLESQAAGDPANEDHTTFWLVLADQFRKRGIDAPSLREKALQIITSGTDLAMLASLGMNPAGLKQRAKMLDQLRQQLLQPVVSKGRPVLRKPQLYLMDIGDALMYPTWRGKTINPYLAREKQFASTPHDGWGAIVIVDRGRAFDFLTWYRPLTVLSHLIERPTLQSLRGDLPWRVSSAGTCNAVHFKRMGFEKIGRYVFDEEKLKLEFRSFRPGTSAAINDISIANYISTPPSHKTYLNHPGRPHEDRIQGLDRLLRN